jgi:hypothetical protein
MATQLTAAQAALLAAVDTVLDDAFANGCQYPMGTTVIQASPYYVTLQSVNSVDMRAQTRATYRAALAALLVSVEATRFVGTVGQPAFNSTWENESSPNLDVCFYKDGFSRVFLGGTVRTSATPSSGLIFTLPSDHAPPADVIFVATDVGALSTTAVILVGSDGTVTLSTPAYASNPIVSLDNISFRVA